MKNKTAKDQYIVCSTAGTGVMHCVVLSPGLHCNTGQQTIESFKTKEKAKEKHGEHAFEDNDDQGEDTLSDDRANNRKG